MILDMTTLISVLSLLCLSSAVFMYFLNFHNKTSLVKITCCSNICFFIGYGLISFRSYLPTFLSFIISNSLIFIGFFLIVVGLRKFFNKRTPPLIGVTLTTLYVVFFCYWYYIEPNFKLRLILFLTIYGTMMLFCTPLLLKEHAKQRQKSYLISLCFLFFLSTMFYLCAVATASGQSGKDILTVNSINQIVIFELIFFIVGWTFSFSLMIHEQLYIEKSLAENRFRALFEGAPDAIVTYDIDLGHFIDVNPQTERLLEYSRETLLKSNPTLFLDSEQPNGQSIETSMKDNNARALAGENLLFERRLRSGTGKIIFAEIRLLRLPSSTNRLLRASLLDITKRKMAEKEIQQLKEELEQRVIDRTAELRAAHEEMEAFTYSISHDLRAPLRAIGGFSQALTEDYQDSLPPEAMSYIEHIENGCKSMATLIEAMLKLSRNSKGDDLVRENVNITAISQTIITELRTNSPERIVETTIAPDITVRADSRLILAVMNNLIENAWKYTSRRTEAHIWIGKEFRNGQPVLFVKDNGVGFDMEYSQNLFKPFQRMHSSQEFEGTGIGLATVKRIIHRHGGEIWAEAIPNVGASFFFCLP
ncbi:membrane hypothetical protein [Azospirillaceae bacterium]